MKIITFVNFNFFYIYIILYVVSLILNDFLFGQNYYDLFEELKFFNSDIQKVFNTHYFFHQIIFHLFTTLFAILLLFIKNKFFSIKNGESTFSKYKIKLIYNNPEEEVKSKISFKFYILTIVIMIIEEQFLDKIFFYLFPNVDFWMIELIIVSYISSKMFNCKIYKHQKFGLYMNAVFPLILKIITIIIINDNNKYLLLGLIIYLILIILRSFINSKIKYYMDLKYIYEEKILILYGLLGTIIFLVYSIITTFISFQIEGYEKNECKSYSNESMFLENITQYFQIYSCEEFVKNIVTELLLELGFIITGSILHFFKKYFSLLVIKYLTPVHIIFSFPLYYMYDKWFLMIYHFIIKKKSFKRKITDELIKFCLDLFGDIISIVCYMVYLEILEFHCCKLDYNIKKNIIKRSIIDAQNIDNTINSEDFKEIEEEINKDLNISNNLLN